MKRVELEKELESLSQFGLVSTDQGMLTGEQPGEATTLSKPLTVISSKGGERGKNVFGTIKSAVTPCILLSEPR